MYQKIISKHMFPLFFICCDQCVYVNDMYLIFVGNEAGDIDFLYAISIAFKVIKNTYYGYILACWISYPCRIHIRININESSLIFILKIRLFSAIRFIHIEEYSREIWISYQHKIQIHRIKSVNPQNWFSWIEGNRVEPFFDELYHVN